MRAKMSATHIRLGTKPPPLSAASQAKAAAGRKGKAIHADRMDEQRAILAKARAVRKMVGTKPELAVQGALSALGECFRPQRGIKGLFHNFDFVLDARKLLIEVDGCYWHGCVPCGYGARKNNKDERITHRATELGWRVLRIWEHDTKLPGTIQALIIKETV